MKMNGGSAHQVHTVCAINNSGCLMTYVDDDVVNADQNAYFKRVVTGKIFPVYTRIFSVSRGSPRATD